jgi:hypothetical protein
MFTIAGPSSDTVLQALAGGGASVAGQPHGSFQMLGYKNGTPVIIAVGSGLGLPGYTLIVDESVAGELYSALADMVGGCLRWAGEGHLPGLACLAEAGMLLLVGWALVGWIRGARAWQMRVRAHSHRWLTPQRPACAGKASARRALPVHRTEPRCPPPPPPLPSHPPQGCVPMGAEDWERARILLGRPAPGAELTLDFNPLEAGLYSAVSVSKGAPLPRPWTWPWSWSWCWTSVKRAQQGALASPLPPCPRAPAPPAPGPPLYHTPSTSRPHTPQAATSARRPLPRSTTPTPSSSSCGACSSARLAPPAPRCRRRAAGWAWSPA